MENKVKFPEMLKKLIDIKGITRKEVCHHLGISAPAFTQYLKGNAKPTFDKLLLLKNLFDVSLDYLVLGIEDTPSTVDYGPLAHYIDMTLCDLQRKSSNHMAMFSKISQSISEQMNSVADEIVSKHRELNISGVLRNEETIALESYSHETCIISVDLHHDIIHLNKDASFMILQLDDIIHPEIFVQKIKTPTTVCEKAIVEKFSIVLRDKLQVEQSSQNLLSIILIELNHMISNNLIYGDKSFPSIDMRRETKKILKDLRQKVDLHILNRKLIEDCFPEDIRIHASTPGKFLPVVAQNILQNRSYRFLLPKKQKSWKPIVTEYLEILQRQYQIETISQKCEFRYTNSLLVNSSVIYRLDTHTLEQEKIGLYHLIKQNILENFLGYTIAPSNENQYNFVMDKEHLVNARFIFEELWKTSEPIS